MMMLAVMYGMMPSAKIENDSNAPPENRLNNPSDTVAGALTQLIDRERVDARHTDRCTDAVQRRRS